MKNKDNNNLTTFNNLTELGEHLNVSRQTASKHLREQGWSGRLSFTEKELSTLKYRTAVARKHGKNNVNVNGNVNVNDNNEVNSVNKVIEALEKQLEVKDKQLAEKDKQLESKDQQMANLFKSLDQQQALQLQLQRNHEEVKALEEPKPSGFWSKVFRKGSK